MKINRAQKLKYANVGLIVFGWLEIFLSLSFFIGLIYFYFFNDIIQKKSNAESKWDEILNLVPMVIFAVWLGIGSIKAKRWASTLWLVFSWVSLAFGVIRICAKTASHFFIDNFNSPLPEKMNTTIYLSTLGIGFVTSVLAPLTIIFFYNNKHVKAIIKTKDTKIPWTDRVPFLVLILSMQMAEWAIYRILKIPFSAGGLLFFGLQLSNVYKTIFDGVFVLIEVYLAWSVYYQKIFAWWLVVGNYLFWKLAWVVGYSDEKMLKIYEDYGSSPEKSKELIHGTFLGYSLNQWMNFTMTLIFFGTSENISFTIKRVE